nr:MAG TPA: hypothetical protein [Bacteriophage sp.]
MNTDHHVKLIEFYEMHGPIKVDKIVLFDDRDFTEEEVVKIIKDDVYEWYSKLIVTDKRNYDTVFRSLKGE